LATSAQSTLIIGHRGASAVAPENTLAAFLRAFEDGAGGIELDVRLARDGVPVVIHDATLKRTGGDARSVADMSSAQLARIDVGSWFNRAHPKLARLEYSKEFVPTLEQVFAILKRAKDPIVYVELKIDRGQEYRALVESVAELISNQNLQKQAVVISFNLKAVALMKELNPPIRTGALFEPRRNAHRVVRKHPMIRAALDCGASEILFHRLLARHRMIDATSEANLRSVVWTVDDPKWIERARTRGIHALITNNPLKMIVDPKK
jgi:glycerophosphoryl diester phosphodiesterase